MSILKKVGLISSLVTLSMVVMILAPTTILAAQPAVNLGSTETFAILAGSTITNTGNTIINGGFGANVGLSPGTAFTGQANVTTSGAVHIADDVAIKAKNDLVMAYDDANGRTPTTRIPSELGGTTLTPGVYDSADGTFQITGNVTLDAMGDPEGVFIFKSASTLITASNSSVKLINSARFCRIFWVVGSSATLGTNSNFVGHILAMTSITANTGAVIQGQLLARNGAVTLDTNTITNGFCEAIVTVPTTATLHVIKHVINDDGGTAVAADFKLHVKTLGNDVIASPAPGAEAPGTSYTLAAGTYTITEEAFTGYTASYSGDGDASGNITLAPGDNKTITITNNDIAKVTPIPTPATLHVIKHVINDNGGTAVAADFKLHVKTSGNDVISSPAPGAEAPGTAYTLAAGTYSITEEAFTGYTASYSGDSDASGNITLAPGEHKTVTITNNDIAKVTPIPSTATLHVIKHVINDDGGTAVAADFKLHVKASGNDVISSPAPGAEAPGTSYTLAAGTYTITEEAFTGYTASYSGDSDASGNITLAPGEHKTVTITNNDILVPAPIIDNGSEETPVVESPTTTVTGGKLPATASHMYELLLIGVVLTLLGAVGFAARKRYE